MTDQTPPLELPEVPPVPAGAPTLAQHCAALAAILRDHCHCELAGPQEAAYRAAIAALAALPALPDGSRELAGVEYLLDGDGRLVPLSLVKASDLLIDGAARRIAQGALSVAQTLDRYKQMCFAEAQQLLAALAADHRVELTSRRGNYAITTYDGAFKVEFSSADRISFGPGIEIARAAFANWLAEAEASPEIKAIVSAAWQLDQAGRLRAHEIMRLARYDLTDPKWQAAMAAVREAMQVSGTKDYMRVYRRDEDGGWRQITLDFANARSAPRDSAA
ncbi:MAG: DUF3164 family protein [Candidatus Hydrogenedens sp.]|nr:DUF3164 family protein [Candidatus Hydrogenedens sp.]